MWSSFAAGIKGPIPNKVKSRPQCSDEGSMVVCACIARLNKNNTGMNEFLMDYCGRIACDGNYDITHGPFMVS
nr:antiterminator Q family protein [Salmonella enterica]